MWESITEKRVVNSTKGLLPIKVPGLKRLDGFTVTHEEQDDPEFGNYEIFKCKGSFGEFTFQASRFKAGKPTSTYVVFLNLEGTSNPKMVCAFSKDIESALLHFPLPEGCGNVSIEKVLFMKNSSLVGADEIA